VDNMLLERIYISVHSGGKVGVDMLTALLTCLVFIGSSYAVLKHDFSSFSIWWISFGLTILYQEAEIVLACNRSHFLVAKH
jgi:hypothetical protein